MGRLDALDLSLQLSHSQQDARLRAAWRRLAQLRLHLGGLTPERTVGPALCVLFVLDRSWYGRVLVERVRPSGSEPRSGSGTPGVAPLLGRWGA